MLFGLLAALVLLGLFATVALLALTPGAAAAQDSEEEPAAELAGVAEQDWCTVTGYVVSSPDELAQQRGELREQAVRRGGGTPLDREDTWVLPDGGQPLVVMDSTAALTGGEVFISAAGQRFRVDSDELTDESHRYLTNVSLPHLGPTTRTLGLEVASGPCVAELTLSVDRSLWSTLVGKLSVAVTALFGLLTVVAAGLRKGGWLRRFLFAAPLGAVAGIGQVVVLHEAGMIDPFGPLPWWGPVAGVVVAALLPLARRRRVTPAGAPLSVDAALGEWRVAGVFSRDGGITTYRVRAAEGDERALVAVPDTGRHQPTAAARLARTAQVLPGVSHPNCIRLREALGGDPAAGLVYEDVDGAPLAELAPRALSGPQSVTVALAALAGLSAVHTGGLVHRDLRPEHVWLDRDGRVLLAGFGHAGTGAPDPAGAPAGGRYASPELVAGETVDQRADLFPVAVMLDELLDQAPEPLAAVLAGARADGREQRPASADAFAEQLRQAAAQAYGADWAGQGDLAGLSLPGPGGPVAGTAGRGRRAVAVTAAAGLAAAAVLVAASLIDSQPAQAQPVTITPEQGRVVFARTIADGLTGLNDFVPPAARGSMRALAGEDDSIADGTLTGIEVGVPRDQHEYPAWFVASGQIPYDDGMASVFGRFDRAAADEPWQLTGLLWSTEAALAAPARDADGWLAEVPESVEPVMAPQQLAETYGQWAQQQGVAASEDEVETGDVVGHDELEWVPHSDSYLVRSVDYLLNSDELARPAEVVDPDGAGTWYVQRSWRVVQAERDEDADDDEQAPVAFEDVSMVPLADGTVLLSVTINAEHVVSGLDEDRETGACGEVPSFRYEGTTYRSFHTEFQVRVQAWLPTREASATPDAAGLPSPSGSPEPPSGDEDADEEEDADDGEPEAAPMLLADPVTATTFATEDSETC